MVVGLKNGYVPVVVTFDQVYECLTGRVMKTQQSAGTGPSLEVNGGTVNVYISNLITKPADKSGMTLDTRSPLEEDIFHFDGQVKWVLFEVDTGSPTVNTLNLLATT